MYEQVEKPKENKSRAIENSTVQTKSKAKQPIGLVDNRPGSIAQRKMKSIANNSSSQPIQKKENNTGLPDNLKTGIEKLSGYSMEDVKVHYNSPKPAQLQAHAYTQGTDIHLASGQEKHLPHEVWHVVQQKQGHVKPTMQMKGKVNINDDAGLEKEADVMGGNSLKIGAAYKTSKQLKMCGNSRSATKNIIQKMSLNDRDSLETGDLIGDISTNKKWKYTSKKGNIINLARFSNNMKDEMSFKLTSDDIKILENQKISKGYIEQIKKVQINNSVNKEEFLKILRNELGEDLDKKGLKGLILQIAKKVNSATIDYDALLENKFYKVTEIKKAVDKNIQANLNQANRAIVDTIAVFSEGAGNIMSDIKKSEGRTRNRRVWTQQLSQKIEITKNFGTSTNASLAVQAAVMKHTKGGSCGEHAYLAAYFLKKAGVPLIFKAKIPDLDHNFILIGNPSASEEERKKWVLCDAWPTNPQALLWVDSMWYANGLGEFEHIESFADISVITDTTLNQLIKIGLINENDIKSQREKDNKKLEWNIFEKRNFLKNPGNHVFEQENAKKTNLTYKYKTDGKGGDEQLPLEQQQEAGIPKINRLRLSVIRKINGDDLSELMLLDTASQIAWVNSLEANIKLEIYSHFSNENMMKYIVNQKFAFRVKVLNKIGIERLKNLNSQNLLQLMISEGNIDKNISKLKADIRKYMLSIYEDFDNSLGEITIIEQLMKLDGAYDKKIKDKIDKLEMKTLHGLNAQLANGPVKELIVIRLKTMKYKFIFSTGSNKDDRPDKRNLEMTITTNTGVVIKTDSFSYHKNMEKTISCDITDKIISSQYIKISVLHKKRSHFFNSHNKPEVELTPDLHIHIGDEIDKDMVYKEEFAPIHLRIVPD
jgi:hypothetical protein